MKIEADIEILKPIDQVPLQQGFEYLCLSVIGSFWLLCRQDDEWYVVTPEGRYVKYTGQIKRLVKVSDLL